MTEDCAKNEHLILLAGTVGSQAYGLATAFSDVDRYEIFLAPTRSLVGIFPIKETWSQSTPDVTMHEVGKFVRLAIRANPTILDLLFLEDYDTLHPAGQMLVTHRSLFPSKVPREAFGGYAHDQARKLKARGDSFSTDTRNRTAKHARHCFRLMRQGAELLKTGTMSLRVPNRDELLALGDPPVAEILSGFDAEFVRFSATETDLADRPDLQRINHLLLEIRETYG